MDIESDNRNPFDIVAPYYDQLMSHVNYPGWVRETTSVAACMGKKDIAVLDMACGTATFAIGLARKTGWPVVGLDSSVGMVRLGKDKLHPSDPVRLVVGDMTRPALRGQFDLIVSLFDSVNFVLTPDDLRSMFLDVYRLLAPGGIFFFDVITECNVVRNFEGEPWEEPLDNTTCRWSSAYDTESKLVYTTLDIKNVASLQFVERIFEDNEIRETLVQSGFEIVRVMEAHTWGRPTRAAERIEYVACKGSAAEYKDPFEQSQRDYVKQLPI